MSNISRELENDIATKLSKEEAFRACRDQHRDLISCFKTCSSFSFFTGCCMEEHKRFWSCYKKHRVGEMRWSREWVPCCKLQGTRRGECSLSRHSHWYRHDVGT